MNISSRMKSSGELTIQVIRRTRSAPLTWRLKNALRWSYIKSWVGVFLIRGDGTRVDYGVVSRRLIADAGVAFLVDDWDGSVTDLTNFKYHGCGTGMFTRPRAMLSKQRPGG